MKNKFFYTLGVVVLATLAFATNRVNAQTTAVGPYYANPSWDQKLQCDSQATCPRFVVLSNWNNAAVLDRETGLVWERSPTLSGNWQGVSAFCAGLKTGGRFGWRLPTIQEFLSLLDPTATAGPPLPAGHPFIGILATADYWTATARDDDPSLAYNVNWGTIPFPPFNFSVTSNGAVSKTTNIPRSGWCVRGGLQAAPQ